MRRFVLTHPDMGVYLGCMMGLGFWSKMDPAGQDTAVGFPTRDLALEHAAQWDETPQGLSTHPVEATIQQDGLWYASVADCVAAGLDGWIHADTPVVGGMQ